MPRFYCHSSLSPDTLFRLPENTVRHINSLRLKNGTIITLFNGDGCEYIAQLHIDGKNAYFAKITACNEINRESSLHITLIQAISTGEKMDFTVQKAVELGVAEIYPVMSAFSNVRLSDERAEKRHRRWQEIAIAACEQCGRNTLPIIHPVQKLTALLNALPHNDLRLFLSPQGSLKFNQIKQTPNTVTLLIGAEGGFSADEEQTAQNAGFQSIQLGKRILRTETAGLATISAIQTRWGDF